MAKIRKPSDEEIQEANGNGNQSEGVIHQQDQSQGHPEGKGDEWLDKLTGDQNERDQVYKDAEQGNFTVPRESFLGNQPVEEHHGRTYSPINARELGDIIVDAIFGYIKDKGNTPNWPRVMSSIGYAQQGLRRRWGELLPRGASKFGKRYADLNRRSAEEKEAQKQANEAVEPARPQWRGGEVLPAITEQPLTQHMAENVPTGQMAEPQPGVAVPRPGDEML